MPESLQKHSKNALRKQLRKNNEKLNVFDLRGGCQTLFFAIRRERNGGFQKRNWNPSLFPPQKKSVT